MSGLPLNLVDLLGGAGIISKYELLNPRFLRGVLHSSTGGV